MNQKKFNLNQEFKNIVKKYGNKIAVNYGNENKYDFNFIHCHLVLNWIPILIYQL